MNDSSKTKPSDNPASNSQNSGHSSHHIPLAVFYAVLAALVTTSLGLFVKLTTGKISVFTVIFARFLIGLCLCIPWVIAHPKEIFPIVSPFKVISRSLLTLMAMSCFFIAIQKISLTDALLLSNSFPLIIPIIFWIHSRIKTPKTVWAGILLGFLGIILVLKPDANFFSSGSWFGLAGAFFSAISAAVIRSLTKIIPVGQILFYNFLIGTMISWLFIPFHCQILDKQNLIVLLIIGVLGTIFQLLNTLSVSKAPVRYTSPLMYLCIPFGTFLDYWLWNNIPDIWDIIGVILVILGGSIAIFYGHKETKT